MRPPWCPLHTPSLTPPLLLLLFLLGGGAEAEGPEDPELLVMVRGGRLRGLRLMAPRGPVSAFLGIPFAEPPVGPRRFLPPEPKRPWPGVLNATAFQSVCYQYVDTLYPGFEGTEMWNPNRELSEDCLYLNVWTPYPRPSSPTPVLVWIYGGGFYSGASSLDVYDGRFLTQAEGTVLVSMNYRESVFRFSFVPVVDGDFLSDTPEALINAGDFHGLQLAGRLAAQGARVYAYIFEHRASTLSWPLWMGVPHGYEIEFIFGLPLEPSLNYTIEERTFAQRLMRYWANFARTGDPNDPRDPKAPQWPPYTAGAQQYVSLNLRPLEVRRGLRAQACAFWNRFLPKLLSATASEAPCTCSGPAHGEAAPRPRPGLPLPLLLLLFLLLSRLLRL